MIQEYARVSVEMPENEEKKSLHQELTYEIYDTRICKGISRNARIRR